MSAARKEIKDRVGSRPGRKWVAENDDELPGEIGRIIDAMARATARRDHHAAMKGDD